MAYAALISLNTTITDLDLSSHVSLSPISVPILKLAMEALSSLANTMLRLDGSNKSYSRKSVNALDDRIKEAVWRFEDLLDSHVYHQICPQSQIPGNVVEVDLDEIRDDIESFTKKLEEFEEEYMYELDHLSPEEDVDVDVAGVENCKMVGLSYSSMLWNIRCKLELKSSLDVMPLVGMGCIGKTALAKKIFFDNELEFECRAWMTIGRKWEPQKVKRDILIQLGEGILKAKRCLVVVDDVWDTDVWDHVKMSLPMDIYERILVLLTTRLRHVAGSVNTRIYKVELLDNDGSWDLLRQRVFGEEDSCPPQLEKAGK